MPREFNQIMRGELQQRLTHGLQIIGEKAPASSLDPVVQAVVVLEDLTKQSIAQAPAERRAGGGEIVGPVVAQFGQVTLLNPNNSGVIVVVEGFTARTNGNAANRWGFVTTPIGVPVTRGAFYDPRNGLPGSVRPSALIYAGTIGADTIFEILGRLSQGTTTTHGPINDLNIVLTPGIGFGVAAEAANVEFSGFFRWTEHSL